jgi:hypothetical protein
MSIATLSPLFSSVGELVSNLRQQGYAVLSPAGVRELTRCSAASLDLLSASWENLRPDTYLKDGGHYRRRRHSCFVVAGEQVTQVPHRAHWQPLAYNALHGGMRRWFEPVEPQVVAQASWGQMLRALTRVFAHLAPTSADGASAGERPWYLEAHQFRIDTTDGIGRPTPEGAHRDGVDFVAVFLVNRAGIKGGETRVFEAAGPHGQRFTLTEPWSLLLLDDARVIHESTPIQPVATGQGHRDTLVLTWRSGGFLGDGV